MRTSLFIISFLCICTSVYAQKNDSIKTQLLHEVEVSTKAKPSATLSTTPLQVLSNEELLQRGIQSVSDAVRNFNGIVLKDYGGIGGLKTIALRGMGAEHTAISYDGVMVSNVQSGQVDIGRFSLDNISMISLNIGQSDNIFQTAKAFASAGVLSLETITPQFTTHNYKGHGRITTGSFGLFNPMIDYAQKLNDTFIVSANGSWQRADGNYPFEMEHEADRKRKNSDVDIFRTEVNLYSNLGKAGQLNTKLYYFDSERGLPGSVIFGNDYAAERLWDKNFFAQMSYTTSLSKKFKLKSQLKYDYVYTRYENKTASIDTRDKYKEQEVYLSNTVGYSLNNEVTFAFSEDLFYNKLRNEIQLFGDNLPYPERYNSLSTLAFKYNNKRLTLTSSLLGTYISEEVKNNREDKTYKKLSPSVSASYKVLEATNLRIRASYKQVYRVPTFSELYYSSIDKTLNPESAKQFNAGVTWTGEIEGSSISFLSLSADGYYNKVDDKIVIIPKTFGATTMNVGKVDIKGLDLKLASNIKISDKINTDLSIVYSYMQAQDLTNKANDNYKDQIPYTPEHSGSATLTLNNPWVNFSYSVIAASKRYSLPLNIKDNEVDGYTDHSISLFRSFDLKNNECYIQGNILNLWDKNYDIIAFYPMAGRSFKVSVGMRF
ncbi:MAG: TonB-dependent receptor [Dysgonomonas sp.]|nr:TonB-dependent receptor [Dysgonomonas sp.]